MYTATVLLKCFPQQSKYSQFCHPWITNRLYHAVAHCGLQLRYFLQKWAAEYWKKQVSDPRKLVVGMAVYGRSMVLTDINKHDMGDPIKGAGPRGHYTGEAGFWAYYEVGKFALVSTMSNVFFDSHH